MQSIVRPLALALVLILALPVLAQDMADEGYPRTMYVSSRPGWINMRAAANTAAAIVTTLSNRTSSASRTAVRSACG